MKKTLLTGLLALAGLTAQAQLPDGSVAPDFTATDINGVEHTLSDYLAEGKTVIMYISATWCGPCWQFHNTHYLSDIYETYGQGGSEDIVVLYIEGDATTNNDHLNGIGPANKTQGDWVTGTPYPIIDNASIANDYDIAYFPTLYRICPETGKTTEIERATPAGLMAAAEAGCHEVTGTPNWADINGYDAVYCDANAGIRAAITNKGGDLNSFKAKLFADGVEVAEQTFTDLEIGPYAEMPFAFDAMTLNEDADYSVQLVEVNGGAPYTEAPEELVSENYSVEVSDNEVPSANNIKVTVMTDYYPNEMAWYLIDGTGNIAHYQSYYIDDAEFADGGGPYSNTTIDHYITLADGMDCYSIVLTDAYGDGWDDNGPGTNTQFGIEITSGNTMVYQNAGTGDWQQRVKDAAFMTQGALGNEVFENGNFAIYPNPSTGLFNFSTEFAVDVTVMDITGKVVHTQNGITNGGTMNLNNLQAGIYVAKVKGNGAEKIEKLVIN